MSELEMEIAPTGAVESWGEVRLRQKVVMWLSTITPQLQNSEFRFVFLGYEMDHQKIRVRCIRPIFLVFKGVA